MKRIELQSLTLEHFRSFVTRSTIEFTASAGLKFISGDNRIQPRLGANGAGKSTIWDALTFCCFGASVRGLRAAELTSWGEKQPYVGARFLIDGEEACIERFGSPNRLLLNAEPVEQIAIDRLLGVSRLRFLQSIVFGQAVPLFIDLSVPERGALLDEVLDLTIWLRLSEAAGKKHSELSRELAAANQSIAFLKGKLEGMPDGDELQRKAAAWEADQADRIERAIHDVEVAERDCAALQKKERGAAIALSALPSERALQQTLERHQRDRTSAETTYKHHFAEMQAATKRKEFFAHTKTCPTCAQTITGVVINSNVRECDATIAKLKREIQVNSATTNALSEEINRLTGELDTLRRKREFLLLQVATAKADLANGQRIVDAAAHAVEIVADAKNPHQTALEELLAQREQAEQDIRAAQGIRRRTQGAALRMDFWRNAFKRVRLFLVKRILSQLALETATAANALGLAGWQISFTTELETKSGTLRPGIHIQVSSPNASAAWEAWSGGEAQRIRLAVALGLASMIQRLAGISVGFEVWDEPSAWLSPEGIEDLLDCLKHRVETTGKSLFLCDHRALIYSGFDEIWAVTKDETGSRAALLSSAEGQ